ncbi:MAG: HEAT repeat domain-containing protein [Cyanobacteria bacterium]|nr:HEAT repeat domain-containing protein [Cyanobacteria bacterium CG_2015-16_32_12]NCO78488.1 HEAT repeat domain-containing protein [Cyanobacteria bacterium CG_2015-22_32_23]NCQ03511.1 HEAT repeat domain-containing protein [Cyanobacteria bacterium CG_2015-09_32_10]NCQ40632.1 HEAT repeat domain-containing protein [Cyanobacteria bacterium CG_2015-04_32_10]NCS83561.1 HEAT repeat domain-containing protein [Cyanobacteria bacterium CG_2015-02_32_10]
MVSIFPEKSLIPADLSTISLDNPETISLELALEILPLGDFEQKWAIAKILVKYGSQVIQPLKKIILDEKANVEHRWYGLKILSEIKNPEIILIVTELLTMTQEEDLLLLASQTLASQGKQSIIFLSQLLDNPSYRLLATQALAQIPSLEVIKPLLSVVNDQDSTIRTTAIATLRNFDTPEIKSVMINALKDYASSVRKEAVIALGLKLKSGEDVELIKLLSPLLEDINLSVAQQTAISLSRSNHIFAIESLKKVLGNENTPIPLKVTIVRSLTWIATPESLQCLDNYLSKEDLDLSITLEIITALGRVRKTTLKHQCVTILSNFYENNSSKLNQPEILQSFCYSLKQLNVVTAVKILKAIEVNHNAQVRFHAQNALKKFEIK